MKKHIISLLTLLLILACKDASKPQVKPEKQEEIAKQLILNMIESLGGMGKYRKLKDVQYKLTYEDTLNQVKDVSLERYIFNGELSRGDYYVHTKNVFPKAEGVVTQAYTGDDAWCIVENEFVVHPQALKMVKFARKVSYFWFNMMYKMLDAGLIYTQMANRKTNWINYKIVKVTYDEKVTKTPDTFVLYINPKTKLVDQFIFYNLETEPRMMWVDYQEIQGLKFPKKLHYKPCDLNGVLKDEMPQAQKLYQEIELNVGLDRSLFNKPVVDNL